MVTVSPKALTGSPLADWMRNGARNGIIPSVAMAWSSLGAPVNDWSPAPMVDNKEPISTTFGCGQAMLATTKLPPILSPNLGKQNQFWYWKTKFFPQTKYQIHMISIGNIEVELQLLLLMTAFQ